MGKNKEYLLDEASNHYDQHYYWSIPFAVTKKVFEDRVKTIQIISDLISFTEECFDNAKFPSDIVLCEQEEYKQAVKFLRKLQIKGQKMNEHNNDYNTLSAKIKTWAKEKGILDKATPIAQCDKTDEEVKELREALIAQNNGLETFTNSKGKKCGTKDEV